MLLCKLQNRKYHAISHIINHFKWCICSKIHLEVCIFIVKKKDSSKTQNMFWENKLRQIQNHIINEYRDNT